jgi:hypothetical protein
MHKVVRLSIGVDNAVDVGPSVWPPHSLYGETRLSTCFLYDRIQWFGEVSISRHSYAAGAVCIPPTSWKSEYIVFARKQECKSGFGRSVCTSERYNIAILSNW